MQKFELVKKFPQWLYKEIKAISMKNKSACDVGM